MMVVLNNVGIGEEEQYDDVSSFDGDFDGESEGIVVELGWVDGGSWGGCCGVDYFVFEDVFIEVNYQVRGGFLFVVSLKGNNIYEWIVSFIIGRVVVEMGFYVVKGWLG